MKVLVIGSGGRENAIALKLSQSPQNPTLIFAPGNPGMAELGQCFDVKADDINGLLALAQSEKVDFTVVGPEIPLVLGVVDLFQANGMPAFGPSALAARLEGSKAFSKDIMAKYKVPTAEYQNFTDLEQALAFTRAKGAPIVVKASGLAAGKGAVVCETLAQAEEALTDMLGDKAIFGDSGKEVVIEEFMTGEEASIFAVCDGQDYVLLASAQDHKRIFDEDKGPNTGGMGAYAPAPVATPDLVAQVEAEVIRPVLEGMKAEGCPYAGVLYVGIMATPQGPKVVEFNCRLGDPETQCVLPLYQGDLLELFQKAATKSLAGYKAAENKGAAAVVVIASKGYPDSYPKGEVISGLDNMPAGSSALHAGTVAVDGQILTNGGRVLGIVGQGEDLKQALGNAYAGVNQISFTSKFNRTDIGQKGLRRLGLL